MKLLSSQDFCVAADMLLSNRVFKDSDDVLSQLEDLLHRTHGFEPQVIPSIIIGGIYQHRYNALIFAEVIQQFSYGIVKIVERDDINSIGCGEEIEISDTVFLNSFKLVPELNEEQNES